MTLGVFASAHQFEQLVRNILKANRFQVQEDLLGNRDVGFDFLADKDNESWAIEVKFYRTARAQVSLLESASTRLASRGIIAGAWKGMLVVSCQLPPTLRITLEQKFSISYVDRADLLYWAAKAPALVDELNSLLETDPVSTQEPT